MLYWTGVNSLFQFQYLNYRIAFKYAQWLYPVCQYQLVFLCVCVCLVVMREFSIRVLES